MKQKFLLGVISLLFFTWFTARAQESEPNDLYTQANTLALNGNNTGTINVSGDVDWWAVTTNADGKLNITITISNGLYMWCQIIDNDGTTLISQAYTNSTTTFSADGLAAGTYYLKCYAYYSGELPAYTISNTLDLPAFSNDSEPNDTKANALVLGLNDSTTGHIGYYYNNHRDTFDWYKVTTNEDGRLALKLESENGLYIWAYLFDQDGTTQLANGYTNDSAWVINQDGLAAGTYYIRINAYYYNSEFVPYKLSDSLYTPNQANDPEPNDTKNDAIVSPVNTTITGHVGYYYNNKRDTADWYQVTLPDDGNLNLDFSSYNGKYFWIYFYDHDGITLLKNGYTNGNTNYHVDGLQKGTYYMKVNSYYDNDFEPYSITNTFTFYGNATDTVMNDYPYLAPTMKANEATTGHIGFYYNNQRDTLDWYKIYYTGAGDLKLKMTQDPHISDASLQYFWVYVYSDTASSPIASQYSSSAAWEMNLSSLSQGYYYIKVNAFYNTDFVSYNIVDSFEQVGHVRIRSVKQRNNNICNTGRLSYRCLNMPGPYDIKLYRFGQEYLNPTLNITLSDSSKFIFSNLPPGVYYAKGYGDGATGNAFGKSKNDTIMPIPNHLAAQNIQLATARLRWKALECISYYKIRYRESNNPTWTEVYTPDNSGVYLLEGLSAGTTYLWQVAAVLHHGSHTIIGEYSDLGEFNTLLPLINNFSNSNNKSMQDESIEGLKTYPNPAQNQFKIQFSNKVSGTANIFLKTATGTVVWNKIHADASSIHNTIVDVSNIPNGMYLLQIILEDGTVYNSKVVISR